ncbi:hypothetical protein [Bacteroides pyogenes]|uniref:hypothetical protein n=1 Tax=Bacteroides pyogenes TaxID=310300 RepID=UPI00126794BF|nr:hypothetical protein [Bacteroides pyogenes]
MFETINPNRTYMLLFVLCLVVVKYGVLAFVLGKKVESPSNSEKTDTLFTVSVLALVYHSCSLSCT